MKAPEMRLVFSCPKCNWRRKTYIDNEDLYIMCKRCGHRFVVGNGKDTIYVEAHEEILVPEGNRDEEKRFRKVKNIIHIILLVAFHVWLYAHFFT